MPPFQYDQSGELIGLLQRLNSPGFMMMYAGPTAPGGWLFTDGSLVLQADFPDLYLVIGNTYNTGGEPPGTFRLPNTLSRSPIGVGQGAGLSNYVLGQIGGEEIHQLLISEMPTHTHLQNAHTHLQDAHTHLQNSHNHLQDAHTHLQNAHTHTQNAHGHTVNDPAHSHSYLYGIGGGGTYAYSAGANLMNTIYTGASTTGISIVAQTATNQNTTAVNQNTTATNQAATATNQNTTAVNQNTTATNNNEGGDGSHNTLHPYLAVNFIIKY